MQVPEPKSDYEMQREQRMNDNMRTLLSLDDLKVGKVVHIPQSAFPDEAAPPEGYWVGKVCKTKKGGMGDVGIRIEGEDIFTRSRLEVVKWLPGALEEVCNARLCNSLCNSLYNTCVASYT